MKIKVKDLRKMLGEELKFDPAMVAKPKQYTSRTYADIDADIAKQALGTRAASDKLRLSGWENFKVGDWLTLDDGTVGQLKKVELHPASGGRPDFTTAYIATHFGHGMEQKADIILKGAREATPDEIEASSKRGEEHRDWVASKIDTSKEGT